MNLICPHCQKMLSVEERFAGQTTNCTFCGQVFQVPPMPPPVMVDLPVDIPLAPEPPPRESPRPTAPAVTPADEGEVYRVAPDPVKPSPPPSPAPRREERVTATTPRPIPAPAAPQPAVSLPPSPPPAGYVHNRTLELSPRVVSWIAPVAFILLFLLMFFPWTGAYPGGYGVYTQSAFRSIVGSFYPDPVGEKVFLKFEEIRKATSSNWLCMFPYVVLVIAGLILAIAPRVVAASSLRLPPAIQRLWPWRSALLLGAAALTFVLLLMQLVAGFGLENALTAQVSKHFAEEREKATSTEDKQQVEIKEGMELGQYDLHRTNWLTLAVLLHILAILGVLSEIWLEKRGQKPVPRIEIQW